MAANGVNVNDASTFAAALSEKILLKRTTSFEHRVSFVVSDLHQLREEFESFRSSTFSTKYIVSERKVNSALCFVFGGQGPQWWAMGRQLYECESIFHMWIDRIDRELRLLTNDWNLIDELFRTSNEKDSRINETNIAQPALFAIQVALAALWISWGIRPAAIVGHSLGEIAAVFVAGRLNLRNAVSIVYHRARLQHRNTRQNGRMVALNLSEEETRKVLQGMDEQVCIAAINSSRSVTLSGDTDALEKLMDVIHTLHPKAAYTWLRVENAFHSHQMALHNIEECLSECLSDISGEPVDIKDVFDAECSQAHLYSTVIGGRTDMDSFKFNSKYWWKNIRQPVLFYQAIIALLRDNQENPIQFFLELSPHPVLATALESIIDSNSRVLASLKRKHDEQECMLSALCHLLKNTDDWKRWFNTRVYYKHTDDKNIDEMLWDLPYYTFENLTYWYETKDSVLTRRANRGGRHPLLGSRIWTGSHALWRNFISLSSPELLYLKDHRINNKVLFPAAGFLEMALTVARELTATSTTTAIVLEQVRFLKGLVLDDNQAMEVHTIVLLPSHDFYIYSRKSQNEDYIRQGGIASNDIIISYTDNKVLQEYKEREWTLHVRGLIDLKVDQTIESSVFQSFSRKYELLQTTASWKLEENVIQSQLYDSLEYRGYQYGPYFKSILAVCGSHSEVRAEISCTHMASGYHFHPTALDGCLQSTLILLPTYHTFVPVSIDKVTFPIIESRVHERMHFGVFTSYRPVIRGIVGADETFSTDVCLLGGENRKTCLINISGLKLQSITGTFDVLRPTTSIFQRLKKFAWLPNLEQNAADVEKVFNEYCFEPIWIKTRWLNENGRSTPVLPKPSDLLAIQLLDRNGSLQQASNIIKDGSNEADQAAIKSFDKVTQWIADIARYVLGHMTAAEEIDRNTVWQVVVGKHRKLVDVLLDLVSTNQTNAKINRFFLRTQYVHLIKTYPDLNNMFSLIDSCIDHLEEFLSGREDPLQWMFQAVNENYLQQYYTTMSQTNTRAPFQAIIKYLDTNLPSVLKILEIGAGTGGSTVHVLDLLLDFANKNNVSIVYVFTDISPSFFASAQSRFAHLLEDKNSRGLLSLSYQVLNVDNVSISSRESFDIVFGSNVVHATKNIVRSLKNIRRLLLPGGLVILVELCLPIPYLDLIFGLLPQWWLSEHHDDELRRDEKRAIISISSWKQAFEAAEGYTHFDASCSKVGLTTIIARKTSEHEQLLSLPERKERVWIIFCDHHARIGEKMTMVLEQIHSEKHSVCVYYNATHSNNNGCIYIKDKNSVVSIELQTLLEQTFHQYSQISIIFAWALDLQCSLFQEETDTTFFELQDRLCLELLRVVQMCQSQKMLNRRPHLFLLTSNTQPIIISQTYNFPQSVFIGFGRSVLHEYDHGCLKLIDVQMRKEVSATFIEQLVSIIVSQEYSTDNEIALIETNNGNAEQYVLRYDSISNSPTKMRLNNSQLHKIEPNKDYDEHPFYLEIPKSKFLTDLSWISETKINSQHLLPTQAVIRIHCVGLIFRDLLQVQGLYPYSYSFSSNQADKDDCVGLEFAGTVACLGEAAAKTYTLGDRVFGIVSKQGAFRSHMILDVINIVKAPNCYSMEQLATLPIAFLTVLLALKERVQLKKDHVCLIHSASGAVGLAAIQYCRLIGAKAIVTAGTDEKRKFLQEKICLQHVFDSRNLSFVENVREVAPNGVDVIINSLSGTLMQQSMALLAPNGHFIEIGKRDIFHNGSLPMFQFRKECTWHVIDAFYHHQCHPQVTQNLLLFLTDHLNCGSLTPIEPMTIFEANQIVDAFTSFKRALHIGKLVVRITSSQGSLALMASKNINEIKIPPSAPTLTMFSDELCYHGSVLITGGFGGVGLAIANWMIEKRGVRHIILLSRRDINEIEPKSVVGQKLRKLFLIANKYSATVVAVKCDVAEYDQLQKVITNINRSEFPLRGVVHGALVLHNSLVTNMTEDIFTKVIQPRVRGAWNLHRISLQQQQKIDFFVLLSSLRNHVIDMGGANYNASNQFFDSIAHFRHNILGLPALSIGVPAVLGTIYVDKSENDPTSLHRAFEPVPFEILFELIERFYLEQNSEHRTLATPVIFAVDWDSMKNGFDYTKTARIQDLIDKRQMIKQEDQIVREKAETNTHSLAEKLSDDLQATVAKIFGSVSVDRINMKKSLVEQGMDSLMAVSLHNWLGSQYSVFIPVSDISQGMSVEDILVWISTKLSDLSRRSEAAPSLTTTMEATSAVIARMERAPEEILHSLSTSCASYRGASLIADFPTLAGDHERDILFCIREQCSEDIQSSLSFAALIASKLRHFSKVCIFLQPADSDIKKMNLVQEYLIQMRRRQPRGNYYLMGYKSGVEMVYQMCSSLVEYQDINIRLLILFYPSKILASNGLLDAENTRTLSINRTVIVHQSVLDQSDRSTCAWTSRFSSNETNELDSSWDENNIDKNNEELGRILHQIENVF